MTAPLPASELSHRASPAARVIDRELARNDVAMAALAEAARAAGVPRLRGADRCSVESVREGGTSAARDMRAMFPLLFLES